MRTPLQLLTLLAAVSVAAAQEPVIPNGSFDADSDADGLADLWDAPHDEGVVVETALEPGVVDDCQRLTCTAFERRSPASHAMLSQTGDFGLVAGQSYRLSFQAKQADIPGGVVEIALRDTTDWGDAGLSDRFRAGAEFREFEFSFQCIRAGEALRLQLWYMSTGTLWIDEVRIEPTEPVEPHYTTLAPPTGVRNLVPNGSFEAGEAGWGSIARIPGWGGNLNRLIGEVVDDQAAIGRRSLRIDLSRDALPRYYFDYFDLYRVDVDAPILANIGCVDVVEGGRYYLSVYARVDRPGLRGRLEVFQPFRGSQEHLVEFAEDWRRYEFRFTAYTKQVFVGAGLDLSASDAEAGTVWLDGFQLEEADAPTEFCEPEAQIGVTCPAPGHTFAPNETPCIELLCSPGEAPHIARIVVTDFYDAVVSDTSVTISPEQRGEAQRVPLLLPGLGVFRVRVSSGDAVVVPAQPLRVAVIQPYTAKDSAFAMNHAYPWAELNDLCVRMGITQFRDWSLKWHVVEPTEGEFDFSETDAQIDRVLERGAGVLPLLPFPSSLWASERPAAGPLRGERETLEVISAMPRDPEAMARYVEATVGHYQDRLREWEILNEPIYTEYALPRQQGYVVEDYVRFLTRAYRAVHAADPEALVIGGIAGPPDLLTREFIAAGGLEVVDALNLHIYPGLAPPEAYAGALASLRQQMRDAGHDLPIYFTEGAYYGDDDPAVLPHSSWLTLLDSEAECAAYQTKLNALLLAFGTQRIVYHSGTPGEANRDEPAGIFFEWNGAPRKMVASQAAMANIVGPPPIVGRGLVDAPEGVFACAFDAGGRTIVACWSADAGEHSIPQWRPDQVAFDFLGNRVAEGAAIPVDYPVFVVSPVPIDF